MEHGWRAVIRPEHAGHVVLVQGDVQHEQINQPLLDAAGRNLVKNFTRVETYGAPFMGWTRGTVDAADPHVLRFTPHAWSAPPPSSP